MGMPMRSFLLVAILALVSPSEAALAAGDVARVIRLSFAGDPGAAGGDVNADGLAGAADVVGAVLGMQSPTEHGPFGVGYRKMTFTKRSETKPDEDRVLLTYIWYPAAPGTGPIDPRLGGKVNVPLADGASNLPLVMFSHGSCGFAGQSTFLTATLASYGIIVVAPPHPGNTTAEIFTCFDPAQEADSFVNRPADIRFVLDQMLLSNADPASFFSGAIDPQRIGMSGHSFGGLTTLRVAASDPRVIAGLALAPSARSIQDEIKRIDIPMMVQDGTLDGLLPDARLAYSLLPPPRSLLEIARMTHSPFSDFCTECTPETLTPAEAHLYVLRYAVPFLLHWVAGDDRFDAFLDPAVTPPGATFIADSGTTQ